MKNKKILNNSLGFVTICLIAFSSTFAYLTDNESDDTNFYVGGVTVDLIEGGMMNGGGLIFGEPYEYWSTQGHNIGVSPYAFNSGYNNKEAVVFMEVVVPLVDVSLIESMENGQPVHNDSKTDAFSFTFGANDGGVDNDAVAFFYGNELEGQSKSNDGTAEWIYMYHTYYSSGNQESCGYLYGYSKKLGEWTPTPALFDWIKVENFTAGSDIYLELPIRLYAIQADSIKGSDVVVAAGSATDDSTAQDVVDVNNMDALDLRYIFNTYINQNCDSFFNYSLNNAHTNGNRNAAGDYR